MEGGRATDAQRGGMGGLSASKDYSQIFVCVDVYFSSAVAVQCQIGVRSEVQIIFCVQSRVPIVCSADFFRVCAPPSNPVFRFYMPAVYLDSFCMYTRTSDLALTLLITVPLSSFFHS